MSNVPRVLLLPDAKGWAFDRTAQAIARHIGDRYAVDVRFIREQPRIDAATYDIVHVFYPLETYHRQFDLRGAKLVTSVCSQRWEANATPREFAARYLSQFHGVAVISTRLLSLIGDLHPLVRLCPDGVDTVAFRSRRPRNGPLVVGWAGNASDPIKQTDILRQACNGLCELRVADGTLAPEAMADFYSDIDVIVCCSASEGGPRTLLEGMSCGNFPVSFPVGIAPELIEHELNGLLVADATVAGLRHSLSWCANNLQTVRSCWSVNREYALSQRNEKLAARRMARLYHDVLAAS